MQYSGIIPTNLVALTLIVSKIRVFIQTKTATYGFSDFTVEFTRIGDASFCLPYSPKIGIIKIIRLD